MARKCWVLVTVTVICLFASALTFGSMGVVVFAMADEFHWSEAEAGSTFTSLTAICALTSLLPIALIPRIGGRGTFVVGTLVLAAGLFLAWQATALTAMLVAAGLFGVSFSLVANAPGIFMIATWFDDRSPRMIALYLMISNLGGVVGPLVADRFVSSPGGWRSHWFWMGIVSVLFAIGCALTLRDRATTVPTSSDAPPDSSGDASDWGLRTTIRRSQFIVLAIAMVLTQTCVITVSSVITAHFTRLDWSTTFAATMLSLQALVGTVATGLAGPISERRDPKFLLVASLAAQAAGMVLLAFARETWAVYAFVALFGIGWAVATFAITVLLIRYFGNKGGSAALSAVWMLCGLAAVGPSIAGWVADSSGSFAPALVVFGALLLPLAVAAQLMKAPASPVA